MIIRLSAHAGAVVDGPHRDVRDRVAGFIEHAAADDGFGRHWNFEIGGLLTGVYCNVGRGGGGDKTGARGIQIVGAGTEVVEGVVAGSVTDGAISVVRYKPAGAEPGRDEGEVDPRERRAGTGVDSGSFESGQLGADTQAGEGAQDGEFQHPFPN